MPIYRACEANNVDPVIQWLCTSANRMDAEGNLHQFLDSVHDSYHQYGRITGPQRVAVERWMNRSRRRGQVSVADIAESTRIADEADTITRIERAVADTAPGSRERVAALTEREAAYEGFHDLTGRWSGAQSGAGAVFNQAQWVFNGDYTVRRSAMLQYRFRIHTLSRSTNPSIVGKRTIAVFREERWHSFAFVSRTGHLSLWSRFATDENDEYVTAARALLEWMRAEDRDSTAEGEEWDTFRYSADNSNRYQEWGISWNVVYCRRCNQSNLDDDEAAYGVHAYDCSGNLTSVFTPAPRRATPVRDVLRPTRQPYRPPTPAPRTPPVPVVELSELGTGWER